MDDRILLRTALITAVIGIAGLFLVSENTEINASGIAKLDQTNIGSDVSITGEITRIIDGESYMMITVEDNGKDIAVMVFKDGILELDKGSTVIIEGELKEYEGELELVANSVRVISS